MTRTCFNFDAWRKMPWTWMFTVYIKTIIMKQAASVINLRKFNVNYNFTLINI